jgi:hypothetical protein
MTFVLLEIYDAGMHPWACFVSRLLLSGSDPEKNAMKTVADIAGNIADHILRRPCIQEIILQAGAQSCGRF